MARHRLPPMLADDEDEPSSLREPCPMCQQRELDRRAIEEFDAWARQVPKGSIERLWIIGDGEGGWLLDRLVRIIHKAAP